MNYEPVSRMIVSQLCKILIFIIVPHAGGNMKMIIKVSQTEISQKAPLCNGKIILQSLLLFCRNGFFRNICNALTCCI